MRQTIVLPLLLAAICGCRSAPPEAAGTVHPLGASVSSAVPEHASAARPSTINRNAPHASAAGPQMVSTTRATPAAQVATASDQPDTSVDLLQQGYKPVQRGGVTFYCHREAMTGSRFSSQVCLTEAQIKERARQAREDMELSRTQGCTNINGGCTGK